eukprot:365207-Chlamydomonas_euryale.AAC.2
MAFALTSNAEAWPGVPRVDGPVPGTTVAPSAASVPPPAAAPDSPKDGVAPRANSAMAEPDTEPPPAAGSLRPRAPPDIPDRPLLPPLPRLPPPLLLPPPLQSPLPPPPLSEAGHRSIEARRRGTSSADAGVRVGDNTMRKRGGLAVALLPRIRSPAPPKPPALPPLLDTPPPPPPLPPPPLLVMRLLLALLPIPPLLPLQLLLAG